MIEAMDQKFVGVRPPQAIVDNASWTNTEIDTLGADFVQVIIYLGATDIAMAALKLQESDVAGSGQTDISGADFSVSPATVPSATEDNGFFSINVNMKGRKRYLTLVATAGDGAAGTFLTAFAILSRLKESPNSASERGFTRELNV